MQNILLAIRNVYKFRNFVNAYRTLQKRQHNFRERRKWLENSKALNFATMEILPKAYKEFYESEYPIDAFPKAIRHMTKTYSVARNLPMELRNFKQREEESLQSRKHLT